LEIQLGTLTLHATSAYCVKETFINPSEIVIGSE